MAYMVMAYIAGPGLSQPRIFLCVYACVQVGIDRRAPMATLPILSILCSAMTALTLMLICTHADLLLCVFGLCILGNVVLLAD